MNINNKEFFDSKVLWEQTRDILFEDEEKYRKQLISKYEGSIIKIKDEVKTYCKENNLTVIIRKNFIEAKYINDYLKIRIDFTDIHLVERYLFNLRIVEGNRREYFIIIKPNITNLDIPKRSVSVHHPTPKNLYESKKFTKSITEEILSIQEKKENLSKVEFVFCYYRAENENPDENKLKHYKNFTQILTSLLS